jgi:hypothetical protein
MIKNSELALISDEALDAVLSPRPAPAPRVPTPRVKLRRAMRVTEATAADPAPEATAP